MSSKLLVPIAASAFLLLVSDAHAFVCSNGVCAQSTLHGDKITVRLRTQLTGMSHYNVRTKGAPQFENHGIFSLAAAAPGQRRSYSVQACRRGGLGQRSICTGWANFHHATPITSAPPPRKTQAGTCKTGYVWRETRPSDRICVTPAERAEVRNQNANAKNNIQPGGGAYGPNTCRTGYVWREAYRGDLVCVTPYERTKAREQNGLHASRVL